MAPKQKGKTMELGEFLLDDSFGGSWADDEVDMSTIGVTSTPSNVEPSRSSYRSNEPLNDERRERKEYPVPENPPFRAKISNLPWNVDEEIVKQHFEDVVKAEGAVSKVSLPRDIGTDRLRGFGFITFESKDQLEEALFHSGSDFDGRRVYVNVAAPEKDDVFNMDWRASRGSMRDDRRPPREEKEFDWGARTGPLPPREREPREYKERRPPREEKDFDWSARGTQLPPREDREQRGEPKERRPPREEKEFDWGARTGPLPPREREPREYKERRPPREEKDFDWSARGTQLPPREARETKDTKEREFKERKPRDEPDLDWSSARNAAPAREQREIRRTPKKSTPEFDWKRGQALEPKQQLPKTKKDTATKKDIEEEEEKQKPSKPSFHVLSIEDEEAETEEPEEIKPAEKASQEVSLTEATSKLTIESNEPEDGWEVVGKK